MFNVAQNATLDINAATTGNTGAPAITSQPAIGGVYSEGALIFKGAGDVNINASVVSGDAVLARYLDNMALTGNLTLTGRSQSGSGIVIDRLGHYRLKDATLYGSSESGNGIYLRG
ncbi:hypothetical protein ACE3VH_004736, partial [Salmonella enterica]